MTYCSMTHKTDTRLHGRSFFDPWSFNSPVQGIGSAGEGMHKVVING